MRQILSKVYPNHFWGVRVCHIGCCSMSRCILNIYVMPKFHVQQVDPNYLYLSHPYMLPQAKFECQAIAKRENTKNENIEFLRILDNLRTKVFMFCTYLYYLALW